MPAFQGPQNPPARRSMVRPFAAPETRAGGLLPPRAAPFAVPGAPAPRRISEPAGVPTALFVEELERYMPPAAAESEQVAAETVENALVRTAEAAEAPLLEETPVPLPENEALVEPRAELISAADVIEAAFTEDADVAATAPDTASAAAGGEGDARLDEHASPWPGLELIAEREPWPIESLFDEEEGSPDSPEAPGFDHSSGETYAVTSTMHAEGLDHLVETTEARDRALAVLEHLTARLRSGDLVVAAGTGTSAESVLASILAALLLDRD